jgi:hypothetical protein
MAGTEEWGQGLSSLVPDLGKVAAAVDDAENLHQITVNSVSNNELIGENMANALACTCDRFPTFRKLIQRTAALFQKIEDSDRGGRINFGDLHCDACKVVASGLRYFNSVFHS